MKLSEKILTIRKSEGLSQEEFADKLEVSRQAVYKWESGQSYPEVAKLLEIKMLFNISIDDLLDENYEVVLPEKKKRKRLSSEVKKEIEAKVEGEEAPIEDEAKAEAPAEAIEEEAPEVKEEAPVAVAAETTAPAPEMEKEPEVKAEAPVEEAPAVEDKEENAAALDKKRGFFGRLFGRK